MYKYFISGNFLCKNNVSGFVSTIIKLPEPIDADGMLDFAAKIVYDKYSKQNNLGPGNLVILNFIYLGTVGSIKA